MLCSKCGLCCKLFQKVSLPDAMASLDAGTGQCKYLDGNLCSIYSQRPGFCNSQWMYEQYYKKQYTQDEYEQMLHQQCEYLQMKFGGT